MHAKIVRVDAQSHLARELGIDAAARHQEPRIDEVRLAFGFAAAKRRQNAVSADKTHERLRQSNPLPVPEAERAAADVRVIENRIESVAARREDEHRLRTQPVAIDGRLHGRKPAAELD